jgi:hypothetical protein
VLPVKGGVDMNKIELLRSVNAVLLITFIIQAGTGVMLFFSLDVGNPEFVANIHKYIGLLFIILALLHVYLNWGWLRANFLTKHQK